MCESGVHILLNCWYLRTYIRTVQNAYIWNTHAIESFFVPCVSRAHPYASTYNITLRLQFSTELDSSVCYTHFLISNAWLYVRFVRLCKRWTEKNESKCERAYTFLFLFLFSLSLSSLFSFFVHLPLSIRFVGGRWRALGESCSQL